MIMIITRLIYDMFSVMIRLSGKNTFAADRCYKAPVIRIRDSKCSLLKPEIRINLDRYMNDLITKPYVKTVI